MSEKKQKKGKKGAKSHPWRDNIEAITVSIITIVLFKYFVLEAYKIPTGSMQPTLMGNPETGIFDRVLVDKLSYHYRDPERFEIVVFRYPLDRSKNFIKRIVGMPNEELEIREGDVWIRPDGEDEWRVLRRPDPVYAATLKRLETEDEWDTQGSTGWSIDGTSIRAAGPGEASFPLKDAIRDYYTDGYPSQLATKLRVAGKQSGTNDVGDLRIEGKVSADSSCTAVEIVLREGERRYTMTLPGPAAASDARPSISVSDAAGEIAERSVSDEDPWRLRAGSSARFRAENLDDRLRLFVAGDLVCTLEVPPATRQRSSFTLRTLGGGADFSSLALFRDIYYLDAGQKYTSWPIPEGSYLMLGDNTQDSSDSRDWQLDGYQLFAGDAAGQTLRGNSRRNENPRIVPGAEEGPLVFFYDELGERHVFPQAEATHLQVLQASFVPRELIRGRAVVVVWPIVPSLGVYRLKWVR